jgi:hypothetical protein
MRSGSVSTPCRIWNGGERRHARAEIAYAFATGAQQEGGRRGFLREHHVVKALVRLGERRELSLRSTFVPPERAGIDEHAADDDAVAREKLRGRVEHEVGPVLERPHEVGRGERRVDQQRQPVVVRNRGDARNVEHVESRIAERLAEQETRLGANRRAPRVGITRIDERRADSEARKRVIEEVVRAAVQRPRRDDVRAGAEQRDDGKMERGLPARRRDRADAALECCDALLEHGHRWIGDPRVHVPRPLHVEERRRVVAVGKHERRGLVDRRRARSRGGIRHGAGMERQRVETMGLGLGHLACDCSRRKIAAMKSHDPADTPLPDPQRRPPVPRRRAAECHVQSRQRYRRDAREAYDDGWSQPCSRRAGRRRAAAPVATTVTIQRARTIIARNDSPDIPFTQSINPYQGASTAASYCYARPTHAYLDLSPGLEFETKLFAQADAAALLRAELASPATSATRSRSAATPIPYQPIEREWRVTRGILEVLAAHEHPFSIVTKSALVERDIDLIAPMAAERAWRACTSR